MKPTVEPLFNIAAENYQYAKNYIGPIAYILVALISLIVGLIALGRLIGHKQTQGSFLSFIVLFLVPIIVMVAYINDKLGATFEAILPQIRYLTAEQSIIISAAGYAIAAIFLNLFTLRVVSFRDRTKKIMQVLAWIITAVASSLVVTLIVLYLTGAAPREVFDNITIVMGILTITIMFFVITIFFVESNRTASKMSRLRLRLVAVASTAILLDGLGNVFTLIMNEVLTVDQQFRTLYNEQLLPSFSFVFYLVYIFGLYFTLFTPLWLQKAAGVLPPSFLKLVQKEQQLKASTEAKA